MTLIFDYDGTIHNTSHLYGCAFRKAYEQLVADGYAKHHYYSDEDMSKYLGMTAKEMWNSFMPDLPKDIMKKTSESIGCEMVNQISEGSAILYRGIESTLDELKKIGYAMVILSNCHSAYLNAHRNHFKLDRWFDGYFCAESFGYLPKEEIFCYIQEEFPDTQYLIIGDRESDFRAGIVNGIPTVGCSYGFGSIEELNVCTAVINTPSELTEAIKKIEKSKIRES